MLEDYLQKIGLSESESKVYIELLKIGSQVVSTIAKRAGFNRTTTYSILKSLENKGIVSSYINGGIKYFAPGDPNCLVGYVDQKCRKYEYYRDGLLALIPKFRTLSEHSFIQHPKVAYFDGVEGVKHLMYDALGSSGVFYCYLCLHQWFETGLGDFILDYKNYRIKEKKVPIKAIVPDTLEVRDFVKNNYEPDDPMTEVLYVSDPECFEMFRNEMNIYDNKVAILHLEKGEEYGVVIESREIADMQRRIFEMAWKGLEKSVE
ncbi:MAG: hypothetical protein O3B47_02435 [bacterium]|nr:hypothetical protein [bacterium]